MEAGVASTVAVGADFTAAEDSRVVAIADPAVVPVEADSRAADTTADHSVAIVADLDSVAVAASALVEASTEVCAVDRPWVMRVATILGLLKVEACAMPLRDGTRSKEHRTREA